MPYVAAKGYPTRHNSNCSSDNTYHLYHQHCNIFRSAQMIILNGEKSHQNKQQNCDWGIYPDSFFHAGFTSFSRGYWNRNKSNPSPQTSIMTGRIMGLRFVRSNRNRETDSLIFVLIVPHSRTSLSAHVSMMRFVISLTSLIKFSASRT